MEERLTSCGGTRCVERVEALETELKQTHITIDRLSCALLTAKSSGTAKDVEALNMKTKIRKLSLSLQTFDSDTSRMTCGPTHLNSENHDLETLIGKGWTFEEDTSHTNKLNEESYSCQHD